MLVIEFSLAIRQTFMVMQITDFLLDVFLLRSDGGSPASPLALRELPQRKTPACARRALKATRLFR